MNLTKRSDETLIAEMRAIPTDQVTMGAYEYDAYYQQLIDMVRKHDAPRHAAKVAKAIIISTASAVIAARNREAEKWKLPRK